jgi:hypothetical protein
MNDAGERIREAAARDEAAAEEPEHEEEAAEEEEPQPAPEPEPAPEEEPEQAEPGDVILGAENAEQIVELEKAQSLYLRKVEKVLGPGNMPPLCPTCQGTGLDFTGGAGEPDYLPSPDRETCPDCGGLGKVLSGSRVETERVLACPTCQGAGHRVKLPEYAPQRPAGENVTTAPPAPAWMGNVQP